MLATNHCVYCDCEAGKLNQSVLDYGRQVNYVCKRCDEDFSYNSLSQSIRFSCREFLKQKQYFCIDKTFNLSLDFSNKKSVIKTIETFNKLKSFI